MFSLCVSKDIKIQLALAALALALSAAPSLAGAQAAPAGKLPAADLSFTYTTLRANVPVGDCGCFWMRGGSGELAVLVWRHFAAVAEVSGERSGHLPGVAGVGLSLASAMGGVRYAPVLHHHFSPFGQGVFGVVHGFDSYFPGATPSGAATAFSMAAGLGLDVPLHQHLLLRPVQAEYQYMQLPNNATNPANEQHDIRLSAGVVLRFTR